MRTQRLLTDCLLLAVLASACAAQPEGDARPDLPIAVSTADTSTATPGPPIATATLTPIQLIGPYTIEGLRGRKFTSNHLDSRVELTKTEIYKRYHVGYRSDGLWISGTLQIPVHGHAPFPVIVMNHGFFSREDYHSGDGTDRAAEYLNQRGYLTLSSDYRSWGGSDVGPSLYYSGLVIDVVNLLGTVASIPEADATRIGMWGHSMGGGVTMKVMMLQTPVRAAALYSTVSADDADILARWGLGCIGDIRAGEHQLDCNSSDVLPLDMPPELIKAYYESSMDAQTLSETSPLRNLDFVTVPIQIHYGTNDGKTSAGTPPEWSRKLAEALEAAGKPVQLFAYDGEYHSFNGDAWNAFMDRCVRFFDEYVKKPAT